MNIDFETVDSETYLALSCVVGVGMAWLFWRNGTILLFATEACFNCRNRQREREREIVSIAVTKIPKPSCQSINKAKEEMDGLMVGAKNCGRKIKRKNKLLLFASSSSFPAKKIAPRLRLQTTANSCASDTTKLHQTKRFFVLFVLNGLKMVDHDNVGQPQKKECVVCDKARVLECVLFLCRCFLEPKRPGSVRRNAGREGYRRQLDLTCSQISKHEQKQITLAKRTASKNDAI